MDGDSPSLARGDGVAGAPLRLLAWQRTLCDCLRRQEPRAWSHFAGPAARERLADAARLELLQTAYPIDRASWPEWYAVADEAAAALGLIGPVVLHQAQGPRGLAAVPAAIVREAQQEAHVVLHGQPATSLAEGEFRALLAHALSHVALWRTEAPLLPAEQVLQSLTAQADGAPAYRGSARRFALLTSVVCDRGALGVAGDASLVIGLLAKLEAERAAAAGGASAGAEADNSAGFLLKADELVRAHLAVNADRAAAADRAATQPPDAYWRAWALHLWSDEGAAADGPIERAVVGTPKLHDLDIVARRRVQEVTGRLLRLLLARANLQTPAVLDHARLYFPDFRPPERSYEDVSLADELRGADASLRDYYCFFLLDLVTADRDVQNDALRAAIQLAGRLGLKDRFSELAQDELGVRKKQLEKLDQA